jgi:hypothetical protein
VGKAFSRPKLNRTKLSVVARDGHPSYERKDCGPDQPGQKARPYLKNNQSRKGAHMTQEVECLPRNSKVLRSNPSTAKKQKQKQIPNTTAVISRGKK